VTARVTALSVTPVKGTRIQTVDSIDLERSGARGNRRFFVIDDRDRMVNAKVLGELQTVVATFDSGRLEMRFADGSCVEEEVRAGAELTVRFFSRRRQVRLVEGPWSEALSRQLGVALRLVEDGSAVDRGAVGAVSLISRASLERLAREALVPDLDARRFRMLVEIEGVSANEEDAWVGRSVRVGEAEVRLEGHVGRCLITSRDPETGQIDLPTLDVLRDYRGEVPGATEPLPFGVYGRVVQEGRVEVGDAVSLDRVGR
jgi:uncharacterized protein YcbX